MTNASPSRNRAPLADAAGAARAHGALAIRVLARVARDSKAPATARVAAATRLLERGYGRAGGEAPPAAELAALTDDQIRRLLGEDADDPT